MAFVIADRVRETSVSTGTGNFTLDGAVTGYQTFDAVLDSADTTYYTIASQGGSEWEVGIGTFTAPATLARTTILSSSNGGSIVTFSAGSKDVFISLPASRTVQSFSAGSTGLTPSTASFGAVTLGGTLAIANGGTGSTTAAGALTALGTVDKTYIDTGDSNSVLLAAPPGAVVAFAQNTAPTGWLKCNGANISRSTYSSLFSAIGTTFGVGDGSTTFGLPDLRGEFVRGWDDGRGVDSGRAFGSSQLDQLQNITGSVNNVWALGAGTGALSTSTSGSSNRPGTGGNGTLDISFNASLSSGARTGTETRPRNVALLYCIKF